MSIGGKYKGAYAFGNISGKIKSVKWMDNNEDVKFIQGNDILAVNFTGQPYGKSYPVRVAIAEI